MNNLSVLSFGSTRGLWEGESAEDFQRLMGYAEHLDAYVVVANSYKRHRLAPRRLAPHVEAIPTDAYCVFDSFLRMLHIGWAALRQRRISLIQAQDPFVSGVAAVLLGKWFRRPVNVCVYGPNVFDPQWLSSHWSHPFLGWLGRWVLRASHGIQVDGRLTAKSLIAAGCAPERVSVKPVVPSNLDRFLRIERKAPAATEGAPVRLLFVGRFAGQKNLPVLLAAVKALRDRSRTPFELHLVGAGPEEQALRELVKREGLESCVHFRGPASRDQIAEVFAAADIFVLTSDYEGFARVLMEAGAAALPIVSTAVSGADEAVLDGRTGYLVPIRDAQAVAEKLAILLSSAELRREMGVAGRAHIRRHLDPRTNTPGQLAIWKKVTEPSGAARLASSSASGIPNGTTGSSGNDLAARTAAGAPGTRPRRLLLFNLVTDAKHPILGFTTQWIRELAARVEHVEVITMCAGDIAVPDNVRVHSAGRERGWSKPRRVLEFYRLLFHVLGTERIDACFSHMIELFSLLAGPFLRARNIPLITWYAHPSVTPTLKLAHRFADRIVTSLPNAYPYKKDKVSVIGQGIDTRLFSPARPAPSAEVDPREKVVLCVGRISRVKNHGALLRAVARLPRDLRVVILGATAGTDDEAYLAELKTIVAEHQLEGIVSFEKPVPPAQLPEHYRRCTVHVNLTPAGFGDKVAWEAMSCGRPCLVANEDFRETLGERCGELLFNGSDPADLAAKIAALLARSPAELDDIGFYLRSQVERLHSLPRLADRIIAELAACRATART